MTKSPINRLIGVIGALLVLMATVSQAALFTFANTNEITIEDSELPPTIANPYPSTISVTSLTNHVVTKVQVTLHSLTHSFPSDICLLLVGPQGQQAILLANIGGQIKFSVTNLTLTLDDDATNHLSPDTPLASGVFCPTNGFYPDFPFEFPTPAPMPNSSSGSELGVFNQTDPSGDWRLFVVDNVSGDTGSISNGWSLTLSVALPLRIARSSTNVVISWPVSPQNCGLQYSGDLATATNWASVGTPPVEIGGSLVLTNPIVGGSQFYRLVEYP